MGFFLLFPTRGIDVSIGMSQPKLYLDRRSFRRDCVRDGSPWWGNSSVGFWIDVCIRKWLVWRLWLRPRRHLGGRERADAVCVSVWRARPDPSTNSWLNSPWWNSRRDCWVRRLGQFPYFKRENKRSIHYLKKKKNSRQSNTIERPWWPSLHYVFMMELILKKWAMDALCVCAANDVDTIEGPTIIFTPSVERWIDRWAYISFTYIMLMRRRAEGKIKRLRPDITLLVFE